MLQTILTELQGGDRAKISQALNAGVKKICEDFEKICLADDESDESFKSALKTAVELLKEQELGSKLLLYSELKRANQALKAQFPSLSIENLEF